MSDERFAEHRGLVVEIANQLASRYRLRRFMDDLLAFGDTGLLEAIERFDPERGAAFATYAWYVIRGRMLDGCRDMGLVARRHRGEALADACYNQSRAATLESSAPRSPAGGLDALACELDEMVSTAGAIFLLQDDDDDRLEVADPAPDPEARTESASVRRFVREQLERLDDDERTVLHMSFYEDKTLDEIGELLDCSRSWASRLRSAALRTLSRRLNGLGAT